VEILWEKVQQFDIEITDIHFFDARNGWIVGKNGPALERSEGIILYTNDGGSTWSQRTSGDNNNLLGIHFISPELGWMMAQDATFLSTSDSGQTWAKSRSRKPRQKSFDADMRSIEADYKLNSVHFESSEGWAVGDYGAILHNVDGGPIWTEQPIDSTSEDLLKVYFINTQSGWIVGCWGTILRTTDGGKRWLLCTSNTGYDLEAVYFVDSQKGWVVGKYGIILHSENGGGSWETQTSGVSNNLYGVCFKNVKEGWIVGGNGVILATKDGGVNWTQEGSGVEDDLVDICYVNDNGLWAIGRNVIIRRR